jgi:hypothetical protein
MAKKPEPTKLERRQVAVEAMLKEFSTRPFGFGKTKNADCMKMSLFLLHKMGVKTPGSSRLGNYKNPVMARQALRRAWEVKTVNEWADKHFERIAPAEALPGDLLAGQESEDHALGALMVYVGNGNVATFTEEHDTLVIGELTFEPGLEPIGAWRTLP